MTAITGYDEWMGFKWKVTSYPHEPSTAKILACLGCGAPRTVISAIDRTTNAIINRLACTCCELERYHGIPTRCPHRSL